MEDGEGHLDYHIEVDKHYYSVPYWLMQHEVRVKVSEQMVEIFHDGKRIAAHERCRLKQRYPTICRLEHWAYKRQSKERFVA